MVIILLMICILDYGSDPDLGDAADDFVGCDTTLGMGICYNDGDDVNFAGYERRYSGSRL